MRLSPPVIVAACIGVAACSSSAPSPSPSDSPPAPLDAGGLVDAAAAFDGAMSRQDSGSPVIDAAGGSDSTVPDGSIPEGLDGGAPHATDAAIPSCTGHTFCDDFESYSGSVKSGAMLGPWKASVGGVATMMVDGVMPYSGTKSLHITVPAGAASNGTLQQSADGGLVAGNNLFGRAMVFYSVSGGNNLPNGVHSWVFNASGNSAASGGNVTMNVANGGTDYFLNYHPATGTEQSVTGGKPSGGVWHCVQWQYDGSGTAPKNEGKIWIDGTVVVDALPAKGWNFATPWSVFEFGFTHYQTTSSPIDIYLDDFALGDAMISCPQ